MLSFLMLIAQAAPPATGQSPGGSSSPGTPFSGFMLLLLLFFVFYIFLTFRAQRKDKQKHADMLANLKRNDRVQTIGGILGTIVDVRDQEVILKVDETSNVKVHFNRGAIKEVLTVADQGK